MRSPRSKKHLCKLHISQNFLTILILAFLMQACTPKQTREWVKLEVNGSPTARHEAGLVAYNDTLILMGGRRINPTDVFNVKTQQWSAKSKTPLELHHFQPVVVDNAVYILGAMTGGWPNETPINNIIIYYPERDEYVVGDEIPEGRRRGGAGAVVYQGKIYLIGGIVNGHVDGYVPWFDEYNPATSEWKVLPDAPHARDHFQAVVNKDKLYAFAGRHTSHGTGQDIDLTVSQGDVFNFSTSQWEPANEKFNIPTQRAGNFAIAIGNEIVIGGGESQQQVKAHNEVEAFNTETNTWTNWPSLQQGRHGSGFAIIDEYLYTVSGCGNRGGEPELETIERIRIQP